MRPDNNDENKSKISPVTAIQEGAENQSEAKGAMQEMQMSLTDMIAGMIQAVIDADQAVTDDYLEAFTRYAFEKTDKGEQLQMVHFEMVDSDGTRQLVSIPKLSLLPLPVLHVQEATFDFEAQMSIRETTEEEKKSDASAAASSSSGFTRRFRREPTATELEKMKEIRRRNLITRDLSNRIVVNVKSPSATTGSGAAQGPTAGPTTTDTEQNINLKVHIKLEPSVLPNGMRGLLQETDRSFQIIRSD